MPFHSLVMTLWTLWLLSLSLILGTCTVSAQPPHKALLADTTVYCNITSDCQPCLPKHLDSEACLPTAYAEHLTCSTSSNTPHQAALTIHRRLAPRTTLLHISRSCKAAQIDSETEIIRVQSSSSSGSSGNAAVSQQAAGKQSALSVTVTDSSSSSDDFGLSVTPMAVHLFPLSTRGGLNLLYFELAMLVLLSGALPVVYIRKRQFVRL